MGGNITHVAFAMCGGLGICNFDTIPLSLFHFVVTITFRSFVYLPGNIPWDMAHNGPSMDWTGSILCHKVLKVKVSVW